MNITLKYRPSKLVFIAVGVLGLGILSLIVRNNGVSGEAGFKRYYLDHFSKLSTAVSSLHDAIEHSDNPKTDLDEYDKLISDILEECAYLRDGPRTPKTARFSQKVQDSAAKSKRLCEDLIGVAKYTQSVYNYARPYLLSDSSSLPSVELSEFSVRINNLKQAINYTHQGLKKVDNSPIQDQGLSELVSQVGATEALIEQASRESNFEKVSTLANQSLVRVRKDKVNILNARIYFWNNTVRINDLKKSITNLTDEFK